MCRLNQPTIISSVNAARKLNKPTVIVTTNTATVSVINVPRIHVLCCSTIYHFYIEENLPYVGDLLRLLPLDLS